VDVLVQGPQWLRLFEVEEKVGDLRAMDNVADLVAGCDDFATCSCPANENVLELFVYEKMNEPYWL